MKFKTTSVFDKRIKKLLTEEEHTQMRQALADNPGFGVVMKNTGGVRKLRWAVGKKGKSGGARIIYYWHNAETENDEIYLLFAFLKKEQDNLTGKQKVELKKFIESEYKYEQDNE
ncbi:hypothetical protein PN36_25000 [Candidatus Thiomargarita nelsonii]|uniref:Toxin HigB-2 n=1 Tax=Candidatus Thiomargarita nelsonii TaxID=1003181 RepID=A0A0A6PRH6_9GAMM|nr:hypothetical protein PN36_25000 [Candidatus Thiomargarita nelsonii]